MRFPTDMQGYLYIQRWRNQRIMNQVHRKKQMMMTMKMRMKMKMRMRKEMVMSMREVNI